MLLDDNLLIGTSPAELGNLCNLNRLHLNNNFLTGELPQSLIQLEYLDELRYQNNAGLCAPANTAFLDWLRSVGNVQGEICSTELPDTYSSIPEHCIESLDGGAVTGIWTNECLSLNKTPKGLHYARYYTFTLDREMTIELTLASRTDPNLILLNETGEVLVQDDEGAFDLLARNSGIRITLDPGRLHRRGYNLRGRRDRRFHSQDRRERS